MGTSRSVGVAFSKRTYVLHIDIEVKSDFSLSFSGLGVRGGAFCSPALENWGLQISDERLDSPYVCMEQRFGTSVEEM